MLRIASAGYLFLIRAASVMVQLRLIGLWFGPSYAGLNALLNQITFYVLLAELGLASAATSLLFKPIFEGDQSRTLSLVIAMQRDTRRIVIWMTLIGSFALTLLCLKLHSEIPFKTLWFASMLSSASALVTLLALPYQCYLNGSDRIPIRNVILGTGFLLKAALGLLFAYLHHTYLAIVFVLPFVAIAELGAQIWASRLTLKLHPVSEDSIAKAKHDIRSVAKFVLFHRIGGLFYFQSDYIILTLSAGLVLVSHYAQFQYLISGALSLFATLTYTFLAKLARHRLSLDDSGQVSLYRRSVFLFGLAAGGTSMLFFLLSPAIVRMVYGVDSFSTMTVGLLALLLMLNLFKSNDDIWIDSSGTYSIAYYLPICESLFYVALGLLLVRYYQIDGIIFAGIATNLIFSVGLKCFIIGRGVLKRSTLSIFAIKVFAVSSMIAITMPLGLLLHSFTRFRPR
jgi:O-antigen/teichoic acid export membrane protein